MAPKGKRIAVVAGVAMIFVLGAAVWLYRAHIRFVWMFEAMGKNEFGLSEYRHRQTRIVMVRVPGGTFMMGSPETEEGREPKEGPVHEVTLSPFLIAKFEVTQAEWKAVMKSSPSHFKGAALPVESVNWDDCKEFCRKTGLRLPTEAEWEYACRAGSEGPFAGRGDLDEMGWYVGNSGGKTHPVGQKAPNNFGLHNMHGNVWEWCEDVFDTDFFSKPEATETDPLCTTGSVGRVFRGGGWSNDAGGCRSACRGGGSPSPRLLFFGFRPAASVP